MLALLVVVDTVSGQRYGRYVTEHIFRPAGHDAQLRRPRPSAADGAGPGHSKVFGLPTARDVPFTEFALGYGHLVSTPG